jgi:hypothetical protein
MEFKSKDLLISSIPSEPLNCGFSFLWCTPFLCFGSLLLCGGTETFCHRSALVTSPSQSLASLATLKEQLKQQIAEIEKQQAAIEKGLSPQTVEEIDVLEGKLHVAIEELKIRKAELTEKPESAEKG